MELKEVLGVGNSLILDDEKLLDNVWKVQENDEIEKVGAFRGGTFR